MGRPEKSSHQFQEIPPGNGKLGGDTQKIKTGGSQESAQPGAGMGALTQDQAHDGHDHDVEPGDEAGVAGRGVDQTDLLQRGAREQEKTGETTTAQQRFASGRRQVAAGLGRPAIEQEEQGQQ